MFAYLNQRYLEACPHILEALQPYINQVRTRSARRAVERLLVYVGNALTANQFEPVTLNAKWVRKEFAISLNELVTAGLLRRPKGYKAGQHSFSYVMAPDLHRAWIVAWRKSMDESLAKPVDGHDQRHTYQHECSAFPPNDLAPEEWFNLLDLSDDENPLTGSLSFMKDAKVRELVTQYVSMLNHSSHDVNVDWLKETMRHGLGLIDTHQQGTKEWSQGMAYVVSTGQVLRRTRGGKYYPQYNRAEGRVFDGGLQQIPKYYDKDRILLSGQWNIDQVGSHVEITRHLLRDQEKDTAILDLYMEDKQVLADELGLKVDVLKRSLLALLNGASIDINDFGEDNTIWAAFHDHYGDYAWPFFKEFIMQTLQLHNDVRYLSLQAECLGASRRPDTNIGYVATIFEFIHKAITIVTNDLVILGDQHDGAIISRKDRSKIKPVIDTSIADELLGVSIEYKFKPLGEAPDPYGGNAEDKGLTV